MKFLNKLERKFGRYAISRLTMYIIATYILGYVLEFTAGNLTQYLYLDPSGASREPGYLYDYYAVFLLLHRYDPGEYLGNFPVQRLYFWRYPVDDHWQLCAVSDSVPPVRYGRAF